MRRDFLFSKASFSQDSEVLHLAGGPWAVQKCHQSVEKCLRTAFDPLKGFDIKVKEA